MHRRGFAAFRTLPLLAAALGLLPGRGVSAGASARPVEVIGIEKPPVTGAFQRLTPEALEIRRGDDTSGPDTSLPLAQLRELIFRGDPPAAPAHDRLRATLTSGEELVADAWGPAPDGLRLSSPAFGEVRVPLEALRWLVPLPARAGPCHDPAGRLAPHEGGDAVRLVGGDEVLGTVAQVVGEGLVVDLGRSRTRTVAWADLLAATLDNPARPAPEGAFAELETLAGDLIQAAAAPTGDAAQGLTVTLRADPGLKVSVPCEALRAVRWRGGRCVDATALAFTSTYRPLIDPVPGSLIDRFLQRDRGARVGRRPRGCPLSLDGTIYRHGWAVHSGSEVHLPLAGAYRSFDARFGVDDEARTEGAGQVEVAGDVDARVLGDGKVLWEAKGVTGAARARNVGPLDVSGVKELVLVVDYGGHDETLDRATWADPTLLR